MKKIMILAFVVVMAGSCLPYRNVMFVDYSNYPDVFISESNSVSFEYEPIGSINATYTGYPSPNAFSPFESNVGITHNNALRKTIEMAVDEVKNKGGNGIINFRYEPVYRGSSLTGWVITGMAIKFANNK